MKRKFDSNKLIIIVIIFFTVSVYFLLSTDIDVNSETSRHFVQQLNVSVILFVLLLILLKRNK